MNIHIAIVHAKYARLILSGRKTMECRLSRMRCEPWGKVKEGDWVYFKVAGGPIVAAAVAREVVTLEDLTPARVATLRTRFDSQICGDDAYWSAKGRLHGGAKVGTLIGLADMRVPERVPRMPRRSPGARKAWFCLRTVRWERACQSWSAVREPARGGPEGAGRVSRRPPLLTLRTM